MWPIKQQKNILFYLIVLFYIDGLNNTKSLNIKVYEAKKTLIKDIGPVNRVHLTVLVSIENIYIPYLVLVCLENRLV